MQSLTEEGSLDGVTELKNEAINESGELSKEDMHKEYDKLEADTAKKIAEEIGIKAEITDNPVGTHIITRSLSSMEYRRNGGFLVKKGEDGNHREINHTEKSELIEQATSSRIYGDGEGINKYLSGRFIEGYLKNHDGMSANEDGSVTVERYWTTTGVNRDTLRGKTSKLEVSDDGMLTVFDRFSEFDKYKNAEDPSSIFTIESKYNQDGVELSSEDIFYDEEGGIDKKVVTKRDEELPFLAERETHDSNGNTVVEYYVISYDNLNNITSTQYDKESKDHYPSFSSKQEAIGYYNSNKDKFGEWSVKTGGLNEDTVLNDAVSIGLQKIIESSGN